jgi:hypothetical protein
MTNRVIDGVIKNGDLIGVTTPFYGVVRRPLTSFDGNPPLPFFGLFYIY